MKATSGNQKADMVDVLAVKGIEKVVGAASSGSEHVGTAGESSVKSAPFSSGAAECQFPLQDLLRQSSSCTQ